MLPAMIGLMITGTVFASAAVAVVANHEMGPWGMWAWIQGLSGGSGSFMGALAGSLLGLTAILLGALYNAHLNRQRDDRIRRQDARSISQAIKAELATIKAALANNAEKMRSDCQRRSKSTPLAGVKMHHLL